MMNKLINGDCLEEMKKLESESIDCVVTDCPYKIIAGGIRIEYEDDETSGVLNKRQWSKTDPKGCLNRGRIVKSDGTVCSNKWLKKGANNTPSAVKNGKMFKHNDIQFSEWLPEVYRVLKKGTHCYIMINSRNLKELQIESEKAGFVFQNLLVWDKGNCLGGNTQIFIKNKKNGLCYRSNFKDLYRDFNEESNNDYQIVSEDGDWKDIKNIFNNGKKKGLNITFRNGSTIFCTEDHLFIKKGVEVKAGLLKVGEVIDTTNFNTIRKEDGHFINYELGWVVGLFLAEGHIQNMGVFFSLSRDKRIQFGDKLIRLSKIINGKYRVYEREVSHCDTHCITSNILAGVINEFISGGSALTKKLKREVYNTNLDFIRGLIDGYLDGDGHYDEKNDRYRINFGYNKELEHDLRLCCNILGYSFRTRSSTAVGFGRKSHSIRGSIKKKKTLHPNERDDGEIMKITNHKQNVYDIEVDGNHRYSLLNGIITHNCTPNKYYMQQLEFILMLSKRPARNINNMGTGNLLSIPNIIGTKIHPTEKPVDLMEILIENSTNKGEIVLDPFAGSAPVATACINKERDYICIELDKEYYEIAKARIEKTTKTLL